MPIWKDLAVETQQGVAAHLQQNPGQQHVDRGRRFAVGIREPGMQRNDGELDAKGDQ